MADPARLGLLFAGQGSQRAGMGGPWRDVAAWKVTGAVAEHSGHDVASLLLDADDDTLRRTDLAQITTFALEMVVLEHLRANPRLACEQDAVVVACAGHSLGEYAALVAAGILEVEDASRLVAARGAAMLDAARAAPGSMVAVVGAPDDDVMSAVDALRANGARAWVANFNAPGQVVVAGDAEGLERVTAALTVPGVKVLTLPVGGAFHSPIMEPAAAPLRAALEEADFSTGTVEVVANVDARAHGGGGEWVDLLARQLLSPVRWTESVSTLTGTVGCTVLAELGPGGTLSAMVKRIAPGITCKRVGPQ